MPGRVAFPLKFPSFHKICESNYFFRSEDKLKAVEADSTEKFSYVNAAELGKATKDPLVCASVFYTCPHDAKAVMEVLKKAAAAAP